MSTVRVATLEEVRSIFGVVEKDAISLIGFERCSNLEVVYLHELTDAQKAQAKTLVEEYGYVCAVVLNKDGVDYWVSDRPGGSGPGSTVVMLFNVTIGRKAEDNSFRVASLNNYRHSITEYSNKMWLEECVGMALPWRSRPRSIEKALSEFGH